MTSKDFSRRLQYFVYFLTAFDCFNDGRELDFIWKYTVFKQFAGSSVYYAFSPYVISSLHFDSDVDNIFIERYSRLRFNVDLKYFKAFLSKLFEYQYESLKCDSRFTNILNYLSNVQK